MVLPNAAPPARVTNGDEWQYRQHAAQFTKIHMPAGEPVLLRREAGEKSSNGGCGGRREHRSEAPRTVPRQCTRAAAHKAIAEAVEHEQHHIAARAPGGGVDIAQRCVRRRCAPAQRLGERSHQVDDTATVVVRKPHWNSLRCAKRGALDPAPSV